MRRPVSLTLLALVVGCFASLTAFTSLLAAVPGFCIRSNPLLAASLFLTSVLGFRAARRIWRQHRGSAEAVVAFTLLGVLNLIVSIITDPGFHRQMLRVGGVASVGLIAAGLLAARKVRQAS